MKTALKVFLFLCVFAASAATSNLNRAVFTSNVVNQAPVNELTSLTGSLPVVFFFTDIVNCAGCNIQHRWYLDGAHVHTTESQRVATPRSQVWSSITTNGVAGNWTVETIINGRVQATRTLEYTNVTGSTEFQRQLDATLQDECAENLTLYRRQAQENPNDPYYEFMYNKWAERCF